MTKFKLCFFLISFHFLFLEHTNAFTTEILPKNTDHSTQFHNTPNNCTKCHPRDNSAELILLTGDPINVKQIPELCGQCHGIMKRDWDRGMHGKKINSWTNSGEKLFCTKCHLHHNPKFPKFKALSPPEKPEFSIPKGHQNE